MPKISVISIAKQESEFKRLREALAAQTFQDFEFVTSTKESIPQAWNDAVSRSKGDIFVFTESDAFPLNNKWLEEIVENAKVGTVLKGLEIKPTDLDLCNLVCGSSIFKEVCFDENFHSGEDVEFFTCLRKMGIPIEFVNAFPVVHVSSQTWRKTLSRGITGGMNLIKIVYLYGRSNVDDVNTRNFKGNYVNPVSNRIRIIVENLLILLGLFVGSVRYLPILVERKLGKKVLERR